MARLALATAGYVIGNTLLPGIGGQVGWALGSMLGGTFEPNQKSAGPRLGDLSVSGSAYGTPIPYILGTSRTAGQIVWASSKREIATTTTQGKGGGGGQEYTSYAYEVDLLILLTDNQIAGVTRIWSNGTLLANNSAGATIGTISASIAPSGFARATVYTGAGSQLPDPTYEAAVGTANAPAYRGRGSIFIQSLQLGSSGQIPNLTFEVVQDGVFSYMSWNTREVALPGTTTFSNFSKTVVSSGSNTVFRGITPRSSGRVYFEIYSPNFVSAFTYGVATADFPQQLANIISFSPSVASVYAVQGYANQYNSSYAGFNVVFGEPSLPLGPVTVGIAVDFDAGQIRIYANGVLRTAQIGDMPYNYLTGNTLYPIIATANAYTYTLRTTADEFGYPMPAGFSAWGDSDAVLLSPNTTTVQAAVSQLCQLAKSGSSWFDATALASITTPVRSLAIGQVSSVRNVLQVLGGAYNFDAVLSDKLYFRPRASASVAAVPFDDLGCDGREPFALRLVNELEVPAQLALTYANIDNDYQSDTQYSDRLLTGQESTSASQLPLGLSASDAKTMADTQLMDKAISMTSATIAVGAKYAKLEACDVITVADEDANAWRMRIIKKSDADGKLTLDLVMDDASIFTQAGTTSAGAQGQSIVNATPSSGLLLLDIPLLQDADNAPGHYAAIKGSAGWQSAGLYASSADNSYTLNQTVFNSATFGVCVSVLGTYTGPAVFDEVSTVTVTVTGGQLQSATRDAVLGSASVNSAVIGSEVVQYRTATLVKDGQYTLSGFLRGRRGTEWAMSGHAAAESFCVLGVAGMLMVPMQSADLGKLWYYKAASAGQALSSVASKTITPAGVLLKPFAPVDCRVNRVTTDTAITWKRRTRLAPRFVGTLGINVPLGEATEAYEVEVYSSGTFVTLKRTITGLTTPAATYTSAQQVTDFGSNQSVLYLKIYQLSATVGRGYALTVTI